MTMYAFKYDPVMDPKNRRDVMILQNSEYTEEDARRDIRREGRKDTKKLILMIVIMYVSIFSGTGLCFLFNYLFK